MNPKNSSKSRSRKAVPLQTPIPLATGILTSFQAFSSLLVRPLWRGVLIQEMLILFLSVLMGWALWSENLNAKFGLFDDHEIVSFLGVKSAIPFTEAMSLFKSTEALHPGATNRYRPSYYFLRFIEIYLWGDSPLLWYLSRMMMFVTSLAIAWALLARFCGFGLSSVLILSALRGPYWAAIWAVLGPSETYACLGLAIYFLGVYLCWEPGNGGGALGWGLILAGTLISAGSKENFTLLMIPTFLLLARQYKFGELKWNVAPFALGAIGFCLFVISAAMIGAKLVNQDTYAQPVDAGRLKPMLSELSFASPAMWALLLILGGFVVLFLPEKRRDARQYIWRWTGNAMFVEGLLYVTYLALIFFYYGKWHPESRYAFPGELIKLAMFTYPLITFLKIPRVANRPTISLASNILVCAGIVYLFKLGFDSNIQMARNNAQRTNTLQDFILKCQRAVANDPAAPIILYPQDLGSYEPIFAVKSFLVHTGMKNPIMLELSKDFGPGGFAPAIVPMLRKSLAELESGSSGFTARSSLNEKHACYYVGFNVLPKSTRCTVIGAVQ